MFRPIVPKVPNFGGTMTDLPETKQPPVASVLGSGATAKHCEPSDEGKGVAMPVIPDVDEQIMVPVVKAVPFGKLGSTPQNGIELEPDPKSPGFPKKSQRSAASAPFALKSRLLSSTTHGRLPWRLTIVLIFQPSSNWA